MGQFIGGLPPGTLLDKRYRVIRLVGKGGFGAVYEASDERFQGGRVAVKELTPSHLNPTKRAAAIANSRREGNLLRSLDHPNLPKVSDFFEENGNAYLVMDFITGKTLKQEQADRGGPLEELRVMGWALELCDVLYYLHTQSPPIIFRDLKPANVMLTTSAQIKLIDFGIARFFKPAADQDTQFVLTPGFAPLEQYGQGQTDERSDIYALGATLYTLLTTAVPADSLMRQINPQMFRTPRQINPKISIVTENVILKAIATDPQHRFQSVLEMYRAIVIGGIAVQRQSGTLHSRFIQQNSIQSSSLGTARIQPDSPSQPIQNAMPNSGPYPPPLSASTPFSGPPPAPIRYPTQGPSSGPYPPYVPAQVSDSGPYPPYVPVQPPASGPYPPPGSAQAPIPGAPQQPLPYPTPMPIPAAPQQTGPQKQGGGVSRRDVLIGLGAAAAAVAAAGAGFYFFSSRRGKTPASVVGPTITLNFTYSTEKQNWIRTVTDTFNQKNLTLNKKSIQVVLDPRGSGEGQTKILSGEIKPTAWSPASFLELSQLSTNWGQKHPGSDIISSGTLSARSLVFSPLVFAIWKERADVLLKHYNGTVDWTTIHDALTKANWADIGGQSAWGPVKFGQTSPVASNSGLLTITLMAYAFFKKQRGLTVADVNDVQFQQFFQDFEAAVNAFGKSSGSFLSMVVIPLGPADYDITTTYENLVLSDQVQAMERQQQSLQLFYPSTNILSDHPFAILKGDWVTTEEQQAAAMFRDFLLDKPQQQLALATGFRPTNSNVSINDKVSNNLFRNQPPDINVSQQIQAFAQAPRGDVINALLDLWSKNYGTVPLTTGDLNPELSPWTLG